MRILTIHADYIEFEATRKAFKGAEEDIEKGKKRYFSPIHPENLLSLIIEKQKRDRKTRSISFIDVIFFIRFLHPFQERLNHNLNV